MRGASKHPKPGSLDAPIPHSAGPNVAKNPTDVGGTRCGKSETNSGHPVSEKERGRYEGSSGEQEQDNVPNCPSVTDEKLITSVRRIERRNTAPEPDRIPGRALSLALRTFGHRIRNLITGNR